MVIVSLVSPVRMMRFDSRDYNEDECISYKENAVLCRAKNRVHDSEYPEFCA